MSDCKEFSVRRTMMRLVAIIAADFVLIFILSLSSCNFSFKLPPTRLPTGTIRGRMLAWTEDTPIEGRHVALCVSEDPEQQGVCRLMAGITSTDSRGIFEFQDVPEGNYLILYESGLGDFEKTMNQWGGRLLRLGDENWLAEFLEIKDLDEWVSHRVPDGISLSPHYAWITSYCKLTLLVDESPFVVSHDMRIARDEGQLRFLLVEVKAEAITQVEFDSVYFSE